MRRWDGLLAVDAWYQGLATEEKQHSKGRRELWRSSLLLLVGCLWQWRYGCWGILLPSWEDTVASLPQTSALAREQTADGVGEGKSQVRELVCAKIVLQKRPLVACSVWEGGSDPV